MRLCIKVCRFYYCGTYFNCLIPEEELKRLQQKTNEFAYSYDVPQNPEAVETVPTCEEEDKEYVPKPELDIPVDIAIVSFVQVDIKVVFCVCGICSRKLKRKTLGLRKLHRLCVNKVFRWRY